MELRFIRDSQGREVDFVLVKDGKPEFAVECKRGEQSLSDNIRYFAARSGIPRFYQVHTGMKDYEVPAARARVMPVTAFAGVLGV